MSGISVRSSPQQAGLAIPGRAVRMFSDPESSATGAASTPSSVAASSPDPYAHPAETQGSAAIPGGSEPPAPANEPTAANGDLSAVQSTETSSSMESAAPSDAGALGDDTASPSADELNQLMDQYAAPHQAPTEGQILEGRVIAVNDLGVVVDTGGKTEGLIPAQEFLEADP